MHFYSFNIGDYASHTRHLSHMEDLAYRRLLDLYYLHEQPLNECSTTVARLINMRDFEKEVQLVLEEFFTLEDGRGWVNLRADAEVQKYHGRLEAASRAGKASAQQRLNTSSTTVRPNKKQEPINKKQETSVESKRATRMSPNFELPQEWVEWVQANKPEVDARQTFEQFKDYWIAKAGADAAKLDWFSTWRNWVRRDTTRKASYQPVNKQAALEERNRAVMAEFLAQDEPPQEEFV